MLLCVSMLSRKFVFTLGAEQNVSEQSLTGRARRWLARPVVHKPRQCASIRQNMWDSCTGPESAVSIDGM